jgi:hypothetical protein
MSYITWEYYGSLSNTVTAEEFKKMNNRAEVFMDVFTHNRVKQFLDGYVEEEATDFEKMVAGAIQLTMCDLIDKMTALEKSHAATGLSGVSNAGYSESYQKMTETEKKAELQSVIRSGLAGTGLAGAL